MTEDNALKILLDVLKDQESFKVGDLNLSFKNNIVTITGWTRLFYLENVTRENALQDLLLVKERFKELTKKSIEFSNFIENKKLEYYLCFDSGKASIAICKEVDNKIIWLQK